MYSYEGLDKILSENKMTKSKLGEELSISSRTIAKIKKGEKLSPIIVNKICDYFDCNYDDICKKISDNPILQILRDEKNNKISGGIYHELQIRMTYNSNHIEGSKLSEDQTRMIFETKTIESNKEILIDDILETTHHFKAIDYCIDIAEDTLTEDTIKKLHYILKHDTKDSNITWFNVGEYKKRPNMVSGQDTTKPAKVPKEMQKLINEYNNKKEITFNDIVSFHYNFEKIHPFQDGNGRVGRLIAFKECLKNNIVPFIIEDTKKLYYYRGLSEWNNEKGYLIETCLDGQDTFKKLLSAFDINYT